MAYPDLGRILIALPILLACLGPAAAQDEAPERSRDRHVGYYYPVPISREVYTARGQTLREAGRGLRVGFVTGISKQMADRPYAPSYAVFAKGTEAEKLIIVALTDGPLDTIYRARAVFADLTAMARLLPIFREFGVQDRFTFFDLAKIMGFSQITVSDGHAFAHQVSIE